MGDMSVTGANELAALTRRLKAAGQTEVKKDLLRGLRTGAKPMVEAAKQSARENLPKRGGLADHVADTKIVVRTRASGRNPGVRVVDVSKGRLADIDRGRLRHPVFGNREVWVTQQVKPGWWSEALRNEAPKVRLALLAAIRETARRVEHG